MEAARKPLMEEAAEATNGPSLPAAEPRNAPSSPEAAETTNRLSSPAFGQNNRPSSSSMASLESPGTDGHSSPSRANGASNRPSTSSLERPRRRRRRKTCALEKEAANLFFCSNCKAHSWQDRAEFQECCGHPQVENIAIRKPLKLPNEPLPIQFCGSPRSQRYNAAYTTTIYDFQGEIVGLPVGMFEQLENDMLQDKYCFQFKELWLKVADRDGSSQLNAPSETSLQTPVTPAAAASPDPSDDDSSDEDAPNLWSGVAPSQSPEKYVYVRFFTKFSNLETLIRAMWPAMFHSIDVYNSLTFIARATCLRATFLGAFLCLYPLTWFFAWCLAEEEMLEDFFLTVDQQGQIDKYHKNELGIEPKRISSTSRGHDRNVHGFASMESKSWHYWKICFFLMCSYVLTTPRSLVELILHLHCRGDHPGKGAFKQVGTRIIFATWMSKEHFDIVDQRGFEWMVPILFVSKFILMVIQVVIWYRTRSGLLQILFKIWTVFYLGFTWHCLRKARNLLFESAKQRWHAFLTKQLRAKIQVIDWQGNEHLRLIGIEHLDKLLIPKNIRVFHMEGILSTLQGEGDTAIRTFARKDRLCNKEKKPTFPPYLKKLWDQVFKKHFPHCLGQPFEYSFLRVHWPLPFREESSKWSKSKIFSIMVCAAFAIFCICVLLDLFVFDRSKTHRSNHADAGKLQSFLSVPAAVQEELLI